MGKEGEKGSYEVRKMGKGERNDKYQRSKVQNNTVIRITNTVFLDI
jgi:hypothetical protein